jgi:hypothetical protein
MCYSHLGNGVRNGAISITQWGFITGSYKVKSIGQWGKILVMAISLLICNHFARKVVLQTWIFLGWKKLVLQTQIFFLVGDPEKKVEWGL